MKKSKIGWSLVLILSTAALIGYGTWSIHSIKRNVGSTIPQNYQETINPQFNMGRGQEEQGNENFGGMMNGNNAINRNYNNGDGNNYRGMMECDME